MFEQERIITPEISLGCNMTLDTKGIYHNETVYSFLKKENNKINNKTFLGILNSKILWFLGPICEKSAIFHIFSKKKKIYLLFCKRCMTSKNGSRSSSK